MLLDLNDSQQFSQPTIYASNELTFEMKKKIEAFE